MSPNAVVALLSVSLLCLACGDDTAHSADDPAQTDASDSGSDDAGDDSTPDVSEVARLEGADGDSAIDAIPLLAEPPHPESDWVDSEVGVKSGSRVIVVLDAGATVGDVNGLLDATSATIVGGDPLGAVMVWQVPFDDTLVGVVRTVVLLNESEAIASASTEGRLQPDLLPPSHGAPDGLRNWSWRSGTRGDNWWLKAGNLPYAWNLRDRILRNDPRRLRQQLPADGGQSLPVTRHLAHLGGRARALS